MPQAHACVWTMPRVILFALLFCSARFLGGYIDYIVSTSDIIPKSTMKPNPCAQPGSLGAWAGELGRWGRSGSVVADVWPLKNQYVCTEYSLGARQGTGHWGFTDEQAGISLPYGSSQCCESQLQCGVLSGMKREGRGTVEAHTRHLIHSLGSGKRDSRRKGLEGWARVNQVKDKGRKV